MKRFSQIVSYLLVGVAASVGTIIGMNSRPAAPDPGQTVVYSDKLLEVQTLIEEKFIGEVETAELYEGAAAGMVGATGDRWSYYMTAEEYASYLETMANAYVGVGITIQVREDGYLDVTQVTKGGGAEAAGVQVGDIITAVEGRDAAELGTSGARDIIRGEEGTFVTVTFRRDGVSMDLTLERRYIETEVATGTMLEGNIGLVTIVNFDERCYSETVSIIETLRQAGAKALIFDVRHNPGGYKSELVDLLDYLLPEGVLFRSEHYTGAVEVDESDASYLDMPMAVLINGDSYSAAEFFAAALREYDAAVLVGEATTGKGYFQNTFTLSDGSAVNLSTGRYTTPNGVCLAGVGLTPDVTVEVDEETAMAIYGGTLAPMEDPQILAAAEQLKGEE